MGHFYDLSEHIMPTLAWGFLGPPSRLQDLCNYFKVNFLNTKKINLRFFDFTQHNFFQDKFLEFLEALYSFDKVRYTSLDELATDVIKRMEELHSILMKKMEETGSNGEILAVEY